MTADNCIIITPDTLDPTAFDIGLLITVAGTAFNFINLSPLNGRGDAIDIVKQRSRIIQREGVDGTCLVQDGIKGNPFQVRSIADTPTFLNAQYLKAAYNAAVNSNLYIVVCGGLNYYTVLGHKYIILDVQSEAYAVGSSAGGLTNGGTGVVEAIWTMVPVFLGVPS